MINWSKFADPYNNESARFSDYIYPLQKANLDAVGRFDHVDRLLNCDVFGNADDRRFAVSQSLSTGQLYDFYSSKVAQIEGAIETLDRYLELHESNARHEPSEPFVDVSGDLVGMVRAIAPRLPDFRVSPPPQPPSAYSPSTRTPFSTLPTSTPKSPRVMGLRTSTSTATTSTMSTRLSIADLLNHPITPGTSSRSTNPSMSPNSSLKSAKLHRSPEEDFVATTLHSVRYGRIIASPRSGVMSPPDRTKHPENHHSSMRNEGSGGRAYKTPRMRRSSKTRDVNSTHHPSTSVESSPKPQQALYGAEHFEQWFTETYPEGTSTSEPDTGVSQNSRQHTSRDTVASNGHTGLKRKISIDTATDVGPVFDRRIHSSEPDSKVTRLSTTDSEGAADAYAYTLNNTDTRAPRRVAYGYIAGDARPSSVISTASTPNGPKVRIRGRTRERVRGPRSRIESRQMSRELLEKGHSPRPPSKASSASTSDHDNTIPSSMTNQQSFSAPKEHRLTTSRSNSPVGSAHPSSYPITAASALLKRWTNPTSHAAPLRPQDLEVDSSPDSHQPTTFNFDEVCARALHNRGRSKHYEEDVHEAANADGDAEDIEEDQREQARKMVERWKYGSELAVEKEDWRFGIGR